MAKLTNEGENHVLNTYLKALTRGSLYLGLYTDAVEPAEDATLLTIAELAVANGYARILLNNADWTVVGDLATHIQKTFTAFGGDWAPATGYFICNVASGFWGVLIFAENFSDGSHTILNGQSQKVTPTVLAA